MRDHPDDAESKGSRALPPTPANKFAGAPVARRAAAFVDGELSCEGFRCGRACEGLLPVGVEEELAIAFHTEDWGVDDAEDVALEGLDGCGYAVDCELMGGGIAHDSSLADVLAAGFELRLDEQNGGAVPSGLLGR